MKRLLTIIFLILMALQTFAQLKGQFCQSNVNSAHCINFINENEFEYYLSNDISWKKGSGTYKLIRKELIFNFNKPEPEPATCSIKINSTESDKDSITFNVFAFDKDYRTPVAFSRLILKNKDGKSLAYSDADLSGKSKFSVRRSADTVSLSIPYVGYFDCLIPVVLDKNYDIEIGLAAGPAEWIEPGITWKWKIKKLEKTGFILKNNDKSIFKKIE